MTYMHTLIVCRMIDQSTLESEAEAASATGSYVVNGTGVVYDPNTITVSPSKAVWLP